MTEMTAAPGARTAHEALGLLNALDVRDTGESWTVPPPRRRDAVAAVRVLHLLGYRDGPSPGLTPDDLKPDRDLASEMPCGFCGSEDGTAEAVFLHHAGHNVFVAIRPCRSCGHGDWL